MNTIWHWTYPTEFPVRRLTFGATERGLVVLAFRGVGEFQRSPHFTDAEWVESEAKTLPFFRQVEQYLKGNSRDLEMPLDLRGTQFQRRCWEALLRIPYGETRSYAQMAEAVGCPRGFRAVGRANNRNPVAIVVPCHRVIETNGKLGGYGGGLAAKEWLLELEGARLALAKALSTKDMAD